MASARRCLQNCRWSSRWRPRRCWRCRWRAALANDLPSSHAAAIETLRNFIAAMEAWEREALRIDKEEIESGLISVDAAFEKKQRALRDVYLEYCVADAQPARLQRG